MCLINNARNNTTINSSVCNFPLPTAEHWVKRKSFHNPFVIGVPFFDQRSHGFHNKASGSCWLKISTYFWHRDTRGLKSIKNCALGYLHTNPQKDNQFWKSILDIRWQQLIFETIPCYSGGRKTYKRTDDTDWASFIAYFFRQLHTKFGISSSCL